MNVKPRGSKASQLSKRKDNLLKQVSAVPYDGLPGSISKTTTRCGKKTCHCSDGPGHPIWFLTYMAEGKKRVERIPKEWVEYVQQKVNEGKEFKEGVNQIFVANAELLVLLRKQGR